MSGSRHTPGPWRLNLSWDADPTIATVEGEPVLQQVAPDAMRGGVDALDEDLQLMAAAPELLEALKEAKYWLIKVGGWNGTDYSDIPCSETIDTAIARAEGRDP